MIRHPWTRLAAGLVLLLPLGAAAQLEVGGDMLDSCSKINALYEDGKLTEARDAARACLAGIEQELEGEIGKYFLENVAGWERMSFEQNKAMGFTSTTARYRKDGKTVNVSLTGGSGGAGLMGGALSGLAQMGMMQGGKQIRVAKLPAVATPEGQVTVSLSDGSLLVFDSPDVNTADEALAPDGMGGLIDAFPVADINRKLTEG